MSAPLFLGIDGGGSTLRVALVDEELVALCTLTESSANPNLIGHDAAQALIRRSIRDLLGQTNLQPTDIRAAAIGVAGAASTHSRDWLLQTLEPDLPASLLVASSDLEIALVGALAQPCGILLLAGTGSAVYGISPAGGRLQIGGWGYLLGDDGSSYWIGRQLLRHLISIHDSGSSVESDALSSHCLNELGLKQPRELIAWLYRTEETPAARIASLARVAIDAASEGDTAAIQILEQAATLLVAQAAVLQRRLAYDDAPIAFAGGLLDNDNTFSDLVSKELGLVERPVSKYPPVIGAALLAKLKWSANKSP